MEQKMWLKTAAYQIYVQTQPASLQQYRAGLSASAAAGVWRGGEESNQPLFCLLDEKADAERSFAALCPPVHAAPWNCNCGTRAVIAVRALFCCCG